MDDPIPKVVEINLRKKYRFMYANFVIATQGDAYLLLQKQDDVVDVLRFHLANIRYGSPNDEARHGHPLAKYGLGFYGFFEVEHSPWIREQMVANRVHHGHSDSMFDGRKHYIACFKDVMLEVTCQTYHEEQMTLAEIDTLIKKQLSYLSE